MLNWFARRQMAKQFLPEPVPMNSSDAGWLPSHSWLSPTAVAAIGSIQPTCRWKKKNRMNDEQIDHQSFFITPLLNLSNRIADSMEWDELGRCFIIIILSRVRATFRLQRDEASTGSHKSLSWKIVDYIFVSWSKDWGTSERWSGIKSTRRMMASAAGKRWTGFAVGTVARLFTDANRLSSHRIRKANGSSVLSIHNG